MSRLGVTIEIPEDDQPTLAALARLEDDLVAKLEQSLNKAKPSLIRSDLLQRLAEDLGPEEGKSVEEIVAVLVNLAGAAYSAQATLPDLVEAALDDLQANKALGLDSHVALLRERLTRLLKTSSVTVISRGTILGKAHGVTFRSLRVMSDFRPIFRDSDDTPQIAAGLISHELALRVSRDKKIETLYISLDGEDLLSMQEIVKRALQKDATLRQFAEQAGAAIVNSVAEQNDAKN